MIGQHALSAAADAVAKGITDFDVQDPYAVGKQQLTAPASLANCGGTEGVQGLNQRGWTAVEDGEGSVSRPWSTPTTTRVWPGLPSTWAWPRMFFAAGPRQELPEPLDLATCFFRPRHADGTWQGPLHTLSWDFNNDYYVEGTAGPEIGLRRWTPRGWWPCTRVPRIYNT